MSSDNHVREAIQTDRSSDSEDLAMEERLTRPQTVFDGPRGLSQTTIDDLPDDALLEIFDFYLDDKSFYSADKWHTLVHVCRWWRSVVFSSPCRLDLRLFCLGRRSVRAMLDIGLDLPIQIDYHCGWMWAPEMMLNNVITALEHPDRVRHISIRNFPETWEEALVGAMQVPFPQLTYLRLEANFPFRECPFNGKVLGRSAPRLRTLQLEYISFQAARGLILSARDLVDLTLFHIPRWGHVPARSLVACLSSLNRLESLCLVTKVAESPRSRPNQPRRPPTQSPRTRKWARAVLPALAKFYFEGRSGYLEDFVARIDTPVLRQLHVSLGIDGNPVLGIPHLAQFMGRAIWLKPCKGARMMFYTTFIQLELPRRGSSFRTGKGISSMAVICSQLSPFLTLVKRLDLMIYSSFPPRATDGMESSPFLELFRSFTAVQSLCVSESLVPLIASALQELIGERVTEVLPNLRNLFLGGPVITGSVQEDIQPFVDARRLSGRPIAIHHWGEKEVAR